MNDEKFVQIFGGIDEKFISEANEDMNFWLGAQEGVVVRADGSRRFPWRTVIASVACAAAVVGAVFLMRNVLKNGFIIEPPSSTDSYVQGGENSGEVSSPESIPNDELTFLVGPDGKAILKSEITYLTNTKKTVATLTENDIGAAVYCEGFAYYKMPCGVGYDNYKNPELFDGSEFLGEIPENTNEWKRVYVGDEICGLKVVSATAHFTVGGADFGYSGHYFSDNDMGIELEGTVEAEGFLRVNDHSDDYFPTSENITFYPCAIDIPLTPTVEISDWEDGFKTRFEVRGVLGHADEFLYVGEYDSIAAGRFCDVECDMDGIGLGDIVYARVTLGNIRCFGDQAVATLEKVERLSEVLAHDDDPLWIAP